MGWPRSADQPLRRTFDTAKPRALLLWAGRVVQISPSAALSIVHYQPLRRTFEPSPVHSLGRFRSVAASISLLKNEPRPASSDKFTNPNAVRQYVQKILKSTCPSAGHATISSRNRIERNIAMLLARGSQHGIRNGFRPKTRPHRFRPQNGH
jgi:hypothetical protein